MKISEMISYLQGVQSEHGDIHVWGHDIWPKRANLSWFSVEFIDNKECKSLSFAYCNAEKSHKLHMEKLSAEAAAKEALAKPKKLKNKKGVK